MLAQKVLQTCLDLGVRDFCLCAGSRNSDLVHALLQHRDDDTLRLFNFFEERNAGFFALGRMQSHERPVAVVTTSGTAVAELLPAVIEAYYQARPLVLLTADRPRRFRGSGAPQAIEQANLFGDYARFWDLAEPGDLPGGIQAEAQPIHFNLCLEEPEAKPPQVQLSIPAEKGPRGTQENARDPREFSALEAFLSRSEAPLLIMAGCLTPNPALVDGLAKLQAPILADPTSGLHDENQLQPWLLRGADRTAAQLTFSRVLRVGGVPSFRAWRNLEKDTSIDVCSLTTRPFRGLARPSEIVTGNLDFPKLTANWRCQEAPADWRALEERNARHLQNLLERLPSSEPACLHQLLAAIPESATVFVGNSLPIRELGLVAARNIPWPVCRANRGANGIDGNLSTFLGLASATEQRECWGLFGDLTTLYDLAAPAVLPALKGKRVRIVVIHNGGGQIFRRLPNFQNLTEPEAAIVENRHGFHFEAWAQAWGLAHRRLEELEATLPDRVVIEINPEREQTEAFWKAWQKPETFEDE